MIARLGRYEILAELGRGGMAEVYLARATGDGGFAKYVAIKRILPHLAREPGFIEMFLDEGRLAARLAHPNVCTVFELRTDANDAFLVMEYLNGLAWSAIVPLLPEGAARARIAASVIQQACEGLDHAHRQRDLDGTAIGLVHRDVSPQNLFVTEAGVCKVLDFGISKALDDPQRTRTSTIKGKPPYMAPEQMRGERVDPRTDVWALGVVLWEALSGRPLFLRSTDFLIYEAVQSGPIPELGGELAPFDAVIARALARDRDARYASARMLADALAAIAPAMPAHELAAALAPYTSERAAERGATVRAAVERDTIATVLDKPRANLTPPRARDHTFPVERIGRRRALAAIVAVVVAGAATAVIATAGSSSSSTAAAPPAVAVVPAIAVDAPSVPPAPAVPPPDAGPERVAVHVHPREHEAPGKKAVLHRLVDPGPGASPGTLIVDTDGFATIFIDGIHRGDTPLRLALPPGTHRVRAVRGNTSTTRTVTVESGQSTPLRLTW